MSVPDSGVVDLDRLRKGCAQCSLHVLCLAAGIFFMIRGVALG